MTTFTSLNGIEITDHEDLSKKDFRNKVWEYIESNKLVKFPLPVQHRIPNFIGANECANKLEELSEFNCAQTVKVDPDKPLEEVRYLTLEKGKKLLVPTPRLSSGLFNLLQKEDKDGQRTVRFKSKSEGLKLYSKPCGLDQPMDIDLIVVGSVAVSRNGRRIGKGEGFSDLEFALMKEINSISDNVLIVTIVHECQVFDDIPSRLFKEYDVPVDVIITPNDIIEVSKHLSRPMGIYWNLLSTEKFLKIPVLRELYESEIAKGNQIELEEDVTLPDEEEIEKYKKSNQRRGGYRMSRGRFRNRFRRSKRDDDENANGDPSNEDDEPPKRRTIRVFTRGRGRGRFNKRRNYSNGRENAEGDTDLYDRNIQVTFNVNKQNKIVGRSVEANEQNDGQGSSLLDNDDVPKGPRPKFRNGPPTFTFFVGGIPKYCRPFMLREELANHDVRASFITWKGSFGFAFLNFHEDAGKEEEILDALQNLMIGEHKLTVAKAKGKIRKSKANHEEKNNLENSETGIINSDNGYQQTSDMRHQEDTSGSLYQEDTSDPLYQESEKAY